MDSSVSPKDEIWFLRVCHHVSDAVCDSFRTGCHGDVGSTVHRILKVTCSVLAPAIIFSDRFFRGFLQDTVVALQILLFMDMGNVKKTTL